MPLGGGSTDSPAAAMRRTLWLSSITSSASSGNAAQQQTPPLGGEVQGTDAGAHTVASGLLDTISRFDGVEDKAELWELLQGLSAGRGGSVRAASGPICR